MRFIPDKVVAMGDLPKAGEWVKLELLLEKIGATGKDGFFVGDFRGVDLYQRYGGEGGR